MEQVFKDRKSRNEIYKLYLAGPLFSLAERTFNHNLKQLLMPFFDVYLPQEDGGLLVNMLRAGMSTELAKEKVFDVDVRAMNECDLLLIILDGRTVDEGAAFELGFAYANGKPCYGFKTDPRQLLAVGNNPMIDAPLQKIFGCIEELLDWAKSYVGQKYYDTDDDDSEEKKIGLIKTEAE